jgi:hypothetical protein
MNGRLLLAFTLAFAAGAHARPIKVIRNGSALKFSYELPASAAAIPALEKQLRTDMNDALNEARGYAEDGREAARDQKREFIQQYYSATWRTLGQSVRLLSLGETVETFTGGAHPNHDVDAIIWDRRLGRKLSIGDLFIRSGEFAAQTRSAYCETLNAERLKRRGGEHFGGAFDECPKLSDLAIAPRDANKNGLFDRIDYVAAPYIAGPYAEGGYQISLPVTAKLIADLKAEYRSSFEAQRQ